MRLRTIQTSRWAVVSQLGFAGITAALACSCNESLPPEPSRTESAVAGENTGEALPSREPGSLVVPPVSTTSEVLASARVCTAIEIPCGGLCRDLSSDPFNCGQCGASCAAGEVCHGSRCAVPVADGPAATALLLALPAARIRCQPGFQACDGTCVDVRTSSLNCGACGAACAVGSNCSRGLCQ